MAAAIKEAVEYRGGRCWHARDSRGQNLTDMLDLVIVLPPYVALVELKSQRRPTTPGQLHTLDLLAECTRIESLIVRPVPKDGETSYDDFLRWIEGMAA